VTNLRFPNCQGYIGSNILGKNAMEDKLNQPQSADINLEGLEGVKKRLASEAVEQKVAALAEAFNYGEAGLALVIEVLKDQSSPIQSVAYLLLKERAEQQVKEALQQYYGEKIKSHELDLESVINAVDKLRTPLNGLIGFQKLILEDMADDPEEERDFLKEAQRLGLHLHKLLIDIRDIVRIEADDMHIELGEVKLDEVFKDVEDFRKLAQKKKLSLYLELPNNHNEIILYSNYAELKRVISNLVDNAIKYTDEGEIKIRAEVIKKKVIVESQEFLHLVKIGVTDTGIGVLSGVQNNLFKPFVNLYGGYTYYNLHGNGIGRGLALSKSLMKKMGGEMNFYSPGEGLGSTVTFTIPMLGSLG
jgi:signal transduction histidine kinase